MKVKCKGCRTYVEKDSALRIGLSSYCDHNCYYESQNETKKKKTKKLAPKSQHNNAVSERVRQHVLTGDNFRCRLCGKQSYNLVFHHVIYKSDHKNKPWQDQPSNGITLCNEPCHLSVVHKNKKRFQSLCLGIIWLREIEGDRHTTIYQLEKRLKDV